MGFFNQICSAFLGVLRSFTVADALDVILVTFILYKGIQFIRKTRIVQFLKAIAVLILLWAVSYYLKLNMMMTVLNAFLQFGVIGLIIIFQPELRNMLESIGRSQFSKFFSNNFFNSTGNETDQKMRHCIKAVVESAAEMAKEKTGALIVFERKTNLSEIVETGTVLEAKPSQQIIGNVFFNKAPLHDGAMIVRDGMIYAAGCILPLTRRTDVDPSLGTRHRSALGMSETSDAVVVVVSEETGQISVVVSGQMQRNYTRETLSDRLESLLLPEQGEEKKKMTRNPFRKGGKK